MPAGDAATGDAAGGASVVVATVGRPERLAVLVDAVLADPAAAELLVVVDGPDERSMAVLTRLAADRPRLVPLCVSRRGQLAALDEGVRRSRRDVVVLLDDDVVLEPGTVAGHLSHHRERPGLVVAGPMPVSPGDRASVATRIYAVEYLAHLEGLRRGEHGVLDRLWTGNVSLRRRDCLAVGLASARFPAHYHADTDLGFRLADAGLEGRYDPALAAAHVHRRDDRGFLRDAVHQGAGLATLHRAHPERLGRWSRWLLVDDLHPVLRVAVVAAGSTRAAGPLSAGCMVVGRAVTRISGRPGPELAAAKLARRVMRWRGSVAGPPAR